MIDGVTNGDALPALERLMQFAGQRHRIIANNVANLSTPNFRPVDVSVEAFQKQLAKAIDVRRAGGRTDGRRNDLPLESTSQVEVTARGLILNPEPTGDNLLFHDGNDRNMERVMQSLVENFMTFRTAAQLLQSRFNLLNTAIRERM